MPGFRNRCTGMPGLNSHSMPGSATRDIRHKGPYARCQQRRSQNSPNPGAEPSATAVPPQFSVLPNQYNYIYDNNTH